MRVSKWVEFETEVDIEIGLTEISAAIGEAWQRTTPDKWEEHPTRNDVILALSHSLIFFKAIKDEQIAQLTPEQRSAIYSHLLGLAARFQLGGCFKPADADVTREREASVVSTVDGGQVPR